MKTMLKLLAATLAGTVAGGLGVIVYASSTIVHETSHPAAPRRLAA